MKIRIVVIDDEPADCLLLSELLSRIPEVEVVGSFTDPLSCSLKVLDLSPDIVVSDICMPEFNGLELMESLKKGGLHSDFVFVTGSDRYAVQAIHQGVVDYVLKPVTKANLIDMIFRFRSRQAEKSPSPGLSRGKIKFSTPRGFFLIPWDDIAWVEASGNYCNICMTDGSRKFVTETLGHLEMRLDPSGFFRIDRSTLINLKYLESIQRKDHLCTLVYGGTTIQLPGNRLRIQKLLEIY